MASKKRAPHEKPISIPLDFDEVLSALLQTPPEPRPGLKSSAKVRRKPKKK